MIGSVTEVQQQLAEQEQRRQQAAARPSAAVTAPASAPFAAGVPGAGHGTTPIALKAAESELTKPGDGKRLPSAPKPEPEHVAWAKRIMRDGYQAPVRDQLDASRILEAAGLNPDEYHADKPPDDAPPGARGVAAASLARERAETEGTARKNYRDRGITPGPADGTEPGHPEPADFGRPYLEAQHAAPSPQSEGPRSNPMPAMTHRVLPDQPYAAAIPPAVVSHYTMGSPSERRR